MDRKLSLRSRPPSIRSLHSSRSGSVLIITLVAIVLLSLTAYTFTSLMLVEDESSRLLTRQVQSKYLVDSGVDYVRLFLTNDEATIREKGGIWDNIGEDTGTGFLGVAVGIDLNNPELVGRFSVLAPNLDDDGNPASYRYGLLDESSKINVNTLVFADTWVEGGGRQFLMALPDMTEQIADAILDWVDPDDEIRDFGTESSYYSGLSPGYQCKNGPLDSLDELLLIRGVTPQLLFGMDTNRNGVIDPIETANENLNSLNNDMLLGWANYLTLYSKETNVNEDGLERININNPDLDQLNTDLGSTLNSQWTKFIIQYRLNGPYVLQEDDEIDQELVAEFFAEPFEDLSEVDGAFTYTQVLDLIGAYTTSDDDTIVPSPITEQNAPNVMQILMKSVTTFEGSNIPGRINTMHAPRRVLAAIPGMTEEILDNIIQLREFELNDPDLTDQNRKYGTWLYTDGLVDLPTMRAMFPFVCAGGDVFKAEIVGYFDDGVGTSRAEVIVDTTVPIPRILFWRDKSHIQAGYSLEQLGVDYIDE